MLGWSHQYLTEEVSYEEFLGWIDFFKRNPPGWQEDLRTYYIMSTAGMGGMKKKPEDIFPSIRELNEAKREADSDKHMNVRSFEASPFGAMFAQAMNKPGRNNANKR